MNVHPGNIRAKKEGRLLDVPKMVASVARVEARMPVAPGADPAGFLLRDLENRECRFPTSRDHEGTRFCAMPVEPEAWMPGKVNDVVAACRLTGDGPMATCMRQPSRARNIAMQALMERFPDATRQTLARLVGYPKPVAGTTILGMARKCAWWRDDWVDAVKAAIDGNGAP